MKTLFSLLLLSSLLLFTACEEEPPATDDPLACIIPTFSQANFLTASRDPFQFQSAAINEDCLEIVVSYGGGCGEVDWNLVFSNNLQTTNDVTFTDAVLSLKDDDTCEALITDTLGYDLIPLQDSNYASIVIKLEGYSSELLYQYQ
jgi:hypothetical protein